MKPYSVDLRERIVDRYLVGDLTQADVAQEFSVSPRTVSEYLRLHRETGTLEPKPHSGGRSPALDETAREKLRTEVERNPDATLEALCEFMGGGVSVSTMWQTLRSMGSRFKKNAARQ